MHPAALFVDLDDFDTAASKYLRDAFCVGFLLLKALRQILAPQP